MARLSIVVIEDVAESPLLAGSRTFGYAVVVVDAIADPVPTLLRMLLADLSILSAYETL